MKIRDNWKAAMLVIAAALVMAVTRTTFRNLSAKEDSPGLTEAENIDHEQFGEGRVEKALHGRKSAQDHLENIKKHVADFVGDAPQSDDLTILFIHYLPENRRPSNEEV